MLVRDLTVEAGDTEEGFMDRTTKQQRESWRKSNRQRVAAPRRLGPFFEQSTSVAWPHA